MTLDALVALRLAMKHNETQELHLSTELGCKTSSSSAIGGVGGEAGMSSNYQHILDEMVKTVVHDQLLPKEDFTECAISSVIQLREYQILISNGWNLGLRSAYDFIEMLLQGKHTETL